MKNITEYTASADIYNHMMKDVDYSGWCDYIEDLADEFGFKTESILDISCGTGTLLNLFPAKVKRGTDLSLPMIKIARQDYPNIEFLMESMLTPKYDDMQLIVNIHDALNYLPSLDMIAQHLKYMYDTKKEGQTYIFDFAMENVAQHHFSGQEQTGCTQDGVSYRRTNHFENNKKQFITDLFIDYPHGKHVHEQHIQYLYTFQEIKDLCMEICPNRFIFLEEFTFIPASDKSERLLVILL